MSIVKAVGLDLSARFSGGCSWSIKPDTYEVRPFIRPELPGRPFAEVVRKAEDIVAWVEDCGLGLLVAIEDNPFGHSGHGAFAAEMIGIVKYRLTRSPFVSALVMVNNGTWRSYYGIRNTESARQKRERLLTTLKDELDVEIDSGWTPKAKEDCASAALMAAYTYRAARVRIGIPLPEKTEARATIVRKLATRDLAWLKDLEHA